MQFLIGLALYGAGWPDQISRGITDYDHGLYAQAIGSYESALPLADTPERRAATAYRLALAELKLARLAEAERNYQDALTIFRNRGDLLQLALSLAALGETYRLEYRLDEALGAEAHALAVLKTLGMEETPEAADAFNITGEVLYDQHHLNGARDNTAKALTIRERMLAADAPELASSLNNLGVIIADQKRGSEGEALLRRALEIRKRHFGPEHPQVASTLVVLASIYLEEKRYKEAAEDCRPAINMMRRFLPGAHPDLLRAETLLALIARRSGDSGGALDILGRAVRDAKVGAPVVTGEYVRMLNLYAQYLDDAGAKQESRQFRAEASKLSREFRAPGLGSTVAFGELEAAPRR